MRLGLPNRLAESTSLERHFFTKFNEKLDYEKRGRDTEELTKLIFKGWLWYPR